MSRRRVPLLAASYIVPPTLFLLVAVLAGCFEPAWTYEAAGWVLTTFVAWIPINYALIKAAEAIRNPDVRGHGREARSRAPKPLEEFVGRRADVERLVLALKPGPCVAISGIVGMGGVGKTELAKVVVEKVSGRFRDGVLWADCGKQAVTTIPDLWAGLLDTQIPGEDQTAKAAAWRGIAAEKEALLVFDNVQPGQDIEPLLPSEGRCAVLITTRDAGHPALTEAQPLSLDPFTPPEAWALAEAVLGPDQAEQQEADAKLLFSLLGHLPLAVSVALHTARDSGRTLEFLRAKLEGAGVLAALGDEPGYQKNLCTTFDTAWENLTADLKEAFHVLALFNEGPSFSTQAFADTVDLPEPEAHPLLLRLARRSLLTDLGEGRWALHSLLREYAGSKGPVWNSIQLRMAQYYLSVAQRADDVFLRGGKDVLRGLALFDREWPHIRAGQAWSARHADIDDGAAALCSRYPEVGTHCLGLRLYDRERAHWLHAAAPAAARRDDRLAEFGHLCALGRAYAAQGLRKQAIGYLEQALAINVEIGGGPDKGRHLSKLGTGYAYLGDARQAVDCFERALAISREMGDRRHEGICLGDLGGAYAQAGHAKEAMDCYQQALAIDRETGDRRGEGMHLGSLGLVYAGMWDARQAIDCCKEALAISREIGDYRQEGRRLGTLGEVYAALGRAYQAIDYSEQALAISREIGDYRQQERHLGALGEAYAAVRNTRAAIDYHEQALSIAREIGDRHREVRHLVSLGDAYRRLRSGWAAIDCYERALVIARQIRNRRDEGICLSNLGSAYTDVGNSPKARDFGSQALRMFQVIDDPRARRLRDWLR
jgi:tetratricopeptide (TPR) repeat protein